MKTYLDFSKKKATIASNKKEAARNLETPVYRVLVSNVHISRMKNYTIV